ncbi:MAG: rubredoxin, partial [Deltaproteobacteria bacterium]|nr:rubredoxin [Deltaproteobacteria bacterium]
MTDPSSKRWECAVCGYVYDESGEPVPWDELPDDWECPVCGADKSKFDPVAEPAGQTPAEEET